MSNADHISQKNPSNLSFAQLLRVIRVEISKESDHSIDVSKEKPTSDPSISVPLQSGSKPQLSVNITVKTLDSIIQSISIAEPKESPL